MADNNVKTDIAITTAIASVFGVGDRIEGNYKGQGRWYPGKITKVNVNGAYDVIYDDGDESVELMLASLVRSEVARPVVASTDDRIAVFSEGSRVETPLSIKLFGSQQENNESNSINCNEPKTKRTKTCHSSRYDITAASNRGVIMDVPFSSNQNDNKPDDSKLPWSNYANESPYSPRNLISMKSNYHCDK